MPPFVHLAIGQFSPRKGDYPANLERLGAIFARIDTLEPRPQVLQLPETALTGYFLEGGVIENAITAGQLARDLDATYRRFVRGARGLDVVLGFYEVWEHKLYNSAMYVTLGEGEPVVRHVHRKVFLPTYGLFDEERYVERGIDVRAFDTPWGRAAILVCEDAWHSLTGTIAALDGAQILFVPTAPPARGAWMAGDGVPGPVSLARWERLARDMADEHGVYVSLAQLVGSEGGKIFAGGSMVAGPKGEIRGRAPLWSEALLTVTLDLGDMTRARADTPLMADLQVMLPHLEASLQRVRAGAPARLAYDAAPDLSTGNALREGALERAGAGRATAGGGDGARRAPGPATSASSPPPAAAPHETVPDDDGAAPPVVEAIDRAGPPPLEIDPALVASWLEHFLREELARRGYAKAVVGVSGGVDSAVTTFLAARALGPENVIAVRLPYRTSSPESLTHAQAVIDATGVRGCTLDITAAVDGYLSQQPDADATRRGNVMARARMIALFDLSAKHRALPLGTGNKTERLFGYFTWHADDTPPVNPIGDLFKTQVWELARFLGVPEAVVAKAPSADLVSGQTDEGDFGISYRKADELLNWMVSGYSDEDLLSRGFDAAEVALVRRRLDGTHWKRRPPTVALLSYSGIGESYRRPVDY